MFVRSLPMACFAAVLGIVAIGCSQGPEALVPVKGHVHFRGRPLPGGVIVFVPDTARGNRGGLAIAEIKPDGSFALKTNDVAGASPGQFKVTISYVLAGPAGAYPQSMLPSKYRDPDQSGLACEVHSIKTNSLIFDLQ